MTFFLTLVFLMLVMWRPQDWLMPWLFGVPVLDVTVFLSLLSLIVEVDSGRVKWPRTPAVALAVGLWIATLVSHIANTYFQGLMDTLPESFKPCFFFVLMLLATDTVEKARTIVLAMVAMSGLMAVHALMQARTGYGFAGQPPLWVYDIEKGGWYSRSMFFGIFEDPNDLGQMLAAAIPLAFAIPKKRSFSGFLMSVGVAYLLYRGLLTTESRGGMVALAAVGVALLFMVLPARWTPYVALLGLLGGLVACATMGGTLLDPSAQERVVFWGMANQAFKRHPIFGLGYGMFWQVADERAAHNAFVTCYTELGFFGYWFWFGLLQLSMIGCWRARLATRGTTNGRLRYLRRLGGVVIASLAGFSGGAYFLSRTFVFPYFFLFALACAVPVLVQRMLPPSAPALIRGERDVMATGTIGAMASIAYVYATVVVLNRFIFG